MCIYHDPPGAGRLPRRRLLALLAALTASTLVRARAAEANGPYLGPIIDAHAHMKEGIAPDPSGLLALCDRVGIQGSLLFGEPWTGAQAARDLAPDRIVPLLAVGYARAVHPDTPFIWAHIGHGDPDVARRLLSRNPEPARQYLSALALARPNQAPDRSGRPPRPGLVGAPPRPR